MFTKRSQEAFLGKYTTLFLRLFPFQSAFVTIDVELRIGVVPLELTAQDSCVTLDTYESFQAMIYGQR